MSGARPCGCVLVVVAFGTIVVRTTISGANICGRCATEVVVTEIVVATEGIFVTEVEEVLVTLGGKVVVVDVVVDVVLEDVVVVAVGTVVVVVGVVVVVVVVFVTTIADRKSTRLNSSHVSESRMPSSA